MHYERSVLRPPCPLPILCAACTDFILRQPFHELIDLCARRVCLCSDGDKGQPEKQHDSGAKRMHVDCGFEKERGRAREERLSAEEMHATGMSHRPPPAPRPVLLVPAPPALSLCCRSCSLLVPN
jgi:hypothetical protein